MNSFVKFLFIVIAPTLALAATSHGTLILNEPFKIESAFIKLDSTWATVILILYIAISSAFFIYTRVSENINEKNEQINSLLLENNEHKRNLQDNASGLWRELKYLNKYKQNEIVADIMEIFTKNNTPVVSVQMYEYFINKSNFYGITEVKINHTVGVAKEGQNQNAILQSYYSIPSYILNAFYKARATADLGYRNLAKALHRFAVRYTRQLNSRTNDTLTKQDVFLLALLILALEKLGLYDDLRITSHDDTLHKLQKNGILRGIIDNGEYYTFTYKSSGEMNNEKVTRTYLTKKITINELQCIFVITADIRDEQINLHQLGNQFTELLVASDLKVAYN
ncbi:hypothetical protein [uncultured Brevibacillus sp.]|uniref:hypothetical protein n=1 Tax=uncultured Brevibacillus sp. TaxID=169970 RepID=UPI00259AB33B|nr:hypothetical protein [uncultured Brevibacillus sp.]